MGRPVGEFLYELKNDEETYLLFWCPGCKRTHNYIISAVDPKRPTWTFDGDLKAPSFSPSLLVNKSDPGSRCHLFLERGQIRFLQDCFHDLRGQTLAVPTYRDC